MLVQILLVGVGGFLGSISRFGINRIVQSYSTHPFPISTMLVNILGCAAIGLLYEYFKHHQLLPTLSLFIAVGFLGSFTTFSAFDFETIQLLKNNEMRLAFYNIGGNLTFCFIGVLLGAWIGSVLKV